MKDVKTDFAARVDERLRNLAKPPGSLGLLPGRIWIGN